MNELLDVCFFYWVRTTFLLKKCLILMFLMNALPTNQQTNQQTDRPTDTAYYRDARTHLKTRPDTRPPVADGWAGAEMRVFPLFNSSVTDQRTGQRTNQQTSQRTDQRTKPLIELRVRN